MRNIEKRAMEQRAREPPGGQVKIKYRKMEHVKNKENLKQLVNLRNCFEFSFIL